MPAELAQTLVDGLRQAGINFITSNAGAMEDTRNSFIYALPGTTMIPFLESLGIQYTVIGDGTNLEAKIEEAVRMMHALKLPVALLFTGEFTV
jgi:hypothetical protein